MKFCSLVLCLSVSFLSVARADIQVGNFSEMNVIAIHQDGSEEHSIQKDTIINIDESKNMALIHYETIQDGNKETKDEWQKLDDLMDAEEGSYFVSKCTTEDVGGTLETITVPAGTFQTCKREINDITVWFGPVTFGVVKLIFPFTFEYDGKEETIIFNSELMSFGK